ncbi:hypothetical protein GOP47_0023486 [Adiantum capillus-veneris]|uniref:Uncharacterized protein n=1 Tax=Adiantum capillus-veneris TaxID=13818 RepID=A0A9D4U3K0_ADICA|nr:hypothetical protein GOP47_0023486 [Adiantum capillus-veneris]
MGGLTGGLPSHLRVGVELGGKSLHAREELRSVPSQACVGGLRTEEGGRCESKAADTGTMAGKAASVRCGWESCAWFICCCLPFCETCHPKSQRSSSSSSIPFLCLLYGKHASKELYQWGILRCRTTAAFGNNSYAAGASAWTHASGLLHGVRPSVEDLNAWIAQNWENRNIKGTSGLPALTLLEERADHTTARATIARIRKKIVPVQPSMS